MTELFQHDRTPAFIEALEANMNEEMACLGRGTPGSEIHEEPGLRWMFSHPTYGPNGVLHATFKESDAPSIHSKITELIELFRMRQANGMFWTVGISSLPHDLGTLLQEHGFTRGEATLAMMMDTSLVNTESLTPANFSIQEITDRQGLEMQVQVEMQAFGSSEQHARRYYDGYLAAGFGKNTSWHHYLGLFNNRPVAMSSLLLHAGVAGIYGVATVPDTRRQGIGAAMALHAVHQAGELGYRTAILAPTAMSERIYRRIGFQDCGTIWHYNVSFAQYIP